MRVAVLVETLRARGVTLEPRGDKLRVVPASAVTPEEVEALRSSKAEVLALLNAARARNAMPAEAPRPTPAAGMPSVVRWYSYPWPEELPRLGRRTVGPFETCAECSAWSWVRYDSMVLCLECARRRV